MRHEIETEPYYPLDELSPYEKIRRRRDPEYSESGRKKPKFQPANFSAVASDKIIIEMPILILLRKNLSHLAH